MGREEIALREYNIDAVHMDDRIMYEDSLPKTEQAALTSELSHSKLSQSSWAPDVEAQRDLTDAHIRVPIDTVQDDHEDGVLSVAWHASRLEKEALRRRDAELEPSAAEHDKLVMISDEDRPTSSSLSLTSDERRALKKAMIHCWLNISSCQERLNQFRDATEFMSPRLDYLKLYRAARPRVMRRLNACFHNISKQLNKLPDAPHMLVQQFVYLTTHMEHLESIFVILSASPKLAESNAISMMNISIQYYIQKFQIYPDDLHSLESIHDFVAQLDEDIGNLATLFADGVENVNAHKQAVIDRMSNQLIGSTFFSSVTATTISFTFQDTSGFTNTVNAFWFLSLVFSVAAVATSLAGLGLRYQTRYGIPKAHDYKFPILWMWFEAVPSSLLSVAISFFAIGFVFWMFSSSQHIAIQIVITAVTGIVVIGFASVSFKLREISPEEFQKYNTKWLYRPFLAKGDEYVDD